jgi:hypothetical protein
VDIAGVDGLSRASSSPRLVAVAALAIAAVAAIRLLAVSDWDPTAFAAFGETTVEITSYAEDKLGRKVITRDSKGHDGRFFFVQANDPLLFQPEENAAILDRPIYRSQRMLYPFLAGGGGLFPPEALIWALIGVNLSAMAIGSWAVGLIASHHGASPWWGLAFVANGGLLSELYIDGAGILAFAAAALGALALEREKTHLAASAFVAAVLAREVMLGFVALLGVFWLMRRKVIPWALAIPSGLAVLAWGLYLRWRIDLPVGEDQVHEITLVPFSGMIEAVTSGNALISDYLMIFVFLLLMVLVAVRAFRSPVYLTWGAVGFSIIAPFLTVLVWQKSFDISRALAPLITVVVLEFALARRRRLAGAGI